MPRFRNLTPTSEFWAWRDDGACVGDPDLFYSAEDEPKGVRRRKEKALRKLDGPKLPRRKTGLTPLDGVVAGSGGALGTGGMASKLSAARLAADAGVAPRRLVLEVTETALPVDLGATARTLATLAARTWRHPISGQDVRFGLSTIERWYYAARSAADAMGQRYLDALEAQP